MTYDLNSMEAKMRKSLIAMGMLLSSSVVASTSTPYYVGADLQIRKMQADSVQADRTISTKKGKQIHGYAGYKFNDYVAVEGGTYITKYSKPNSNSPKINTHGLHLGVVGFYPLIKDFSLIGGLSGAHLNLKTKDSPNNKINKKTKINPRVLLGGQYSVMENLAIRAGLILEKTKDMNNGAVKLKNSMNYSLGAQYSF